MGLLSSYGFFPEGAGHANQNYFKVAPQYEFERNKSYQPGLNYEPIDMENLNSRANLFSLLNRVEILPDGTLFLSGTDIISNLGSIFKLYLEKINIYYKGDEAYSFLVDSIQKGPEFASELKELRQNRFLRGCMVKSRVDLVEADKMSSSYDDTFPFNHLLFFEEKDPQDIKWMNVPVSDISSEDEMIFKNSLRNILPDNPTFYDNEDLAYEVRTSSSYSEEMEASLPAFFQRLKTGKPKLTSKFTASRKYMMVGPGNSRDSIILTPDSLYTILRIGRDVLSLLDHIKTSAMKRGLRIEDVRKKLKKYEHKMKRTHGVYVRDFTKEGLTKNRALIRFCKEVLTRVYPGVESFHYMDIYDNLKIVLDCDIEGVGKSGQIFEPLRGHGLGMANELTTLIQCVLFEIYSGVAPDIEGLFYNDDSIVVGLEASLPLVMHRDIEVMENYSLIYKDKKSYILEYGGVFLEEYFSIIYEDSNKKEKLLRCALKNLKLCHNVAQAKSIFNSVEIDLSNELIRKEFIDLVNFWGPEFFEGEENLPHMCGGWYTPKSFEHDESLIMIESLEFDVRMLKAFRACKSHVDLRPTQRLRKRFKIKNFRRGRQVDNSKFLQLEEVDGLAIEPNLLSWNEEALFESFLILKQNRMDEAKLAHMLYEKRKKEYSRYIPMPFSFTDLVNEYLEANKFKYIAIPDRYCESNYVFNLIEIKNAKPNFVEDIRRFDNPSKVLASHLESLPGNVVYTDSEKTDYHLHSLNYYFGEGRDFKVPKDKEVFFARVLPDPKLSSEKVNNFRMNFLLTSFYYYVKRGYQVIDFSDEIRTENHFSIKHNFIKETKVCENGHLLRKVPSNVCAIDDSLRQFGLSEEYLLKFHRKNCKELLKVDSFPIDPGEPEEQVVSKSIEEGWDPALFEDSTDHLFKCAVCDVEGMTVEQWCSISGHVDPLCVECTQQMMLVDVTYKYYFNPSTRMDHYGTISHVEGENPVLDVDPDSITTINYTETVDIMEQDDLGFSFGGTEDY
jgi:hypothetical protein